MTSAEQTFLEAINSVTGSERPVGLHQPTFGGDEWTLVKDCLDSGWVSSVGKYVSQFEQLLENYTGCQHAVATVNGTAALHICLKLAGVSRDDEVLLPALTFVATANAVSYCAATPHFVDVSDTTLGVDPVRLRAYLENITEKRSGVCVNRETGNTIRALIVMHAFGHPAEMDALAALCEDYGIILIEDAAEALGSYYQEQHVGHWGQLSALSFNGNKIITTGGGGAILTNDPQLAERAHHLTTTAKQPHPWAFIHDEVGYNYRMPNINAALGCAQMAELDGFIAAKRSLAESYAEALQTSSLGTVIAEPEQCRSNYWLNLFRLSPEHAGMRDRLMQACHEAQILVRPAWELMHRLPMYGHCPRMDLTTAEALEASLICLPSTPMLGITK